uniref:Uncharacterized protein n=1 Tax=Hippocampus comes TaxID=109280 RepID=A0A3Q2ZC80_HIPCM
MPEPCVSVSEFVGEVLEDWSSPTTSSFSSKMSECRSTVHLLEEVSTPLAQGSIAGGDDTHARTHTTSPCLHVQCHH